MTSHFPFSLVRVGVWLEGLFSPLSQPHQSTFLGPCSPLCESDCLVYRGANLECVRDMVVLVFLTQTPHIEVDTCLISTNSLFFHHCAERSESQGIEASKRLPPSRKELSFWDGRLSLSLCGGWREKDNNPVFSKSIIGCVSAPSSSSTSPSPSHPSLHTPPPPSSFPNPHPHAPPPHLHPPNQTPYPPSSSHHN